MPPMPNARCPMPDAQCPMPNAQRTAPNAHPPTSAQYPPRHPEQVKTLSTGLDLMIGMAILGALLTRVAASSTRVAASLTRIAALAPTVAAWGTYGCRRAVPHALGRGASPRDDHVCSMWSARPFWRCHRSLPWPAGAGSPVLLARAAIIAHTNAEPEPAPEPPTPTLIRTLIRRPYDPPGPEPSAL